jgi:hypothetical protein
MPTRASFTSRCWTECLRRSPPEDLNGNPHDFSESATLQRADQVDLVGQGKYDGILGTAHLGILNSPETWGIAFDFLTDHSQRR